MYYFREVPEAEVPAATVQAAHRALAFARHDLALWPLHPRWFVPCERTAAHLREEHNIAGRTMTTRGDQLWLRADLSPAIVMATTFHECRHLWQNRADEDPRIAFDTATQEADASAYASQAIARYRHDDDLYHWHLADVDGLGGSSEASVTLKGANNWA